MNRLFEMGAKIDDGWSSDNKNKPQEAREYKSLSECNIKVFTQKRRGKIVTIADGIEISKSDAKKILKELKSSLGRGGTFKDSHFEFQGECVEILKESLKRYY